MDANLKARLFTGFVGIPLLLFLIGWGDPWLFHGFCLLVTFGALHEYFSMGFRGRPGEQIIGIAFGLAVSSIVFFPQLTPVELILAPLLVLMLSLYIFMPGQLEERLARLAWALLGSLYLGYLLPHWSSLFRLPHGRAWVFFVLVVIMAGDTCAYFVGHRFGTQKLAPEISPGKTVEGAIGYVLGSILAGCLMGISLALGLSWWELAILSALLSILGQLGDLFESWIKRVFAVKDSGRLLPG
ncbi:MAG TPA: phosphatidate cytidylyltransferase, partial [Candidatus Binatia bacterium]